MGLSCTWSPPSFSSGAAEDTSRGRPPPPPHHPIWGEKSLLKQEVKKPDLSKPVTETWLLSGNTSKDKHQEDLLFKLKVRIGTNIMVVKDA